MLAIRPTGVSCPPGDCAPVPDGVAAVPNIGTSAWMSKCCNIIYIIRLISYDMSGNSAYVDFGFLNVPSDHIISFHTL